MRDPNRIPDAIEKLRTYWEQNPDLRLGQIVSNATPATYNGDPFYVEDEDLLANIPPTKKMPPPQG